MKLVRTAALSAALMTAAVPAFTSPAHAWGWGWYGYSYPYYGYYVPAYSYGYGAGYTCPAYEGRYAYYPYVGRHMLRACCS